MNIKKILRRTTALVTLSSAICLISCQIIEPINESSITDEFGASEQNVSLWPNIKSPILFSASDQKFVNHLIANMTTEEKVGQILQAEIQTISPTQARDYHIGSVLNGGGSLPNRNEDATASDWAQFADSYYAASMDKSDGFNAIPIFWGTDAVHGHNNVKGATIFPHNIGLGATRNEQLIRRIGEATAAEVRATGIEWVFAPTVAVARNDRWGRTYESYSESPELVAQLAEQMVIGLQGQVGTPQFLDQYHVAATAKHFLADGGTIAGDDQGNAVMSEADLIRIHNPGYVRAIEAGVMSIMASFSQWNGEKMHGHKYLLSDVLKQKMGFDGFVVGDWNGHGQVPNCTNVSCPQSINAGIDHVMVPYDWQQMYYLTLAQVKSGEISVKRLDDAVKRILLVKKRLGLFEGIAPSTRALGGNNKVIGANQHREIARQAVRESLVLLKNNNKTLPIKAKQHILVTGPGANNIGQQSGGWSVTWQGTGTKNNQFPGATSIYQGLLNAAKKQNSTIELSHDDTFTQRPDTAIVVIGETPYAEGQGDINTLEFEPSTKASLKLIKALKAKNIPVVTVFLSGRPMWVNPELNASDAFVAAWLPGSEGQGVADVLLTDEQSQINHDFAGTLSFSWPKTPTQFELNIDDDKQYDPLFPYGYGLTYQDSRTAPIYIEQMAGVSSGQPQDIALYKGRPLQPWHIVLENQGKNQLLSGAFAQLIDQTITVTTSDKDVQEDALTVKFDEAWSGAVYLAHGTPLDLTPYLAAGSLSFDLNVTDLSKGGLNLTISCGKDCTNMIDLWPYAKSIEGKGWVPLDIPLSCLSSSKSDFSEVEKPFNFRMYGSGEFSFASVQLNINNSLSSDSHLARVTLPCPKQETLSTTATPLRAHWADSWWMNRHNQKKQEARQWSLKGQDTDVLLIGDSITHGWEKEGQSVWQQHFSDINTMNLGFGGDRTENVLWRLDNGALTHLNPKLTVIMIGTNNTGHRSDPPEKIRQGVEAILQRIKAKQVEGKILLLAIFPRGENANNAHRQNNVLTNTLLKTLARDENVLYADFNGHFLLPGGELRPNIMPDKLHPNTAGYEIWAQQLAPYIQEIVRNK